MSIKIKAGEPTEYDLLPAGAHEACCVSVIDMGLQPKTWMGETTMKRVVRITWEVDEKRPDDKPFMLSQNYTLSLHENSLMRKHLAGWRGADFKAGEELDLGALLGKTCQLIIIHNAGTGKHEGKTFANIAGISKPTGNYKPQAELLFVDTTDATVDAYGKLPDFLKEAVDLGHARLEEVEERLASDTSDPPAKGGAPKPLGDLYDEVPF